FLALSLSLSVSVLLSLVRAISLVPVMGQWAARRAPAAQAGDGWLDRLYGRLLETVLRRPALAVAVAVLLAAGTALLASRVGTGFLPASDEGGFVIDYTTPAGSALAET